MLRQLAQSRPDDPFPRYGIAMELDKQGDTAGAQAAFQSLLDAHPDYLPAYLMAGNVWARAGDRDKAASIYDRGMEIARGKGDEHTLSELQAARAELP